MNVRPVFPADIPAVYELLIGNGWKDRIPSLQWFTELVAASQVAEVAVVEEQVVGFIRGISDGLSNGYLSMVVVAPSHRSKGLGRQLVQSAIGTNPQVTWVLRAGREGAAEFFARLGFEPSSISMELRRAERRDF